MGSIKVSLDELAGCAMQFHTIAITLEDLKSSMDHVFGSVDSKIKRRRNIDGSIADIQKSMKALYTEIENISLFISSSKDTYEKMETRLEKESNSFIDRLEDIAGLKKEWYQENWFKIAVGTVVTGIAIAAVVIAGPELMVIAVCTVVGGGIGGITEGIESVQNGGTFIDGFSDGFMWGSIGGFASGAVIVSGAGLVASSYAGGAIDSAVYAGRCIQDGRTVTAEGVVGNFVTGAAVWAGGTLILGKVAKCAEEKLAKSVIDEVTTAGNPEIIGKEAKQVAEGRVYSGELMSLEDAARYDNFWRNSGIGSEKTWNEFSKYNPNGTIDDYFKLIKEQSPWPDGYNPYNNIITLKEGDTFKMVLDSKQKITKPGGFGLLNDVPSVDFARNDMAIKLDWKLDCGKVVEYKVKPGIKLNVPSGPIGAQIDLRANKYLKGNASITQLDLFNDLGKVNRNNYIEAVPVFSVK
ncbi:hypothetical protein [Caproiciproducens galactitolivorans]|uniref:Uncharacterized protein n=1 Tax=Caproiciproducens galactitolivorans TaxID=642589 RepID=A0ABT4BSU6_9FIRM|nr:hypothetical protein [Caproiciproducens galactitolivorans]MCY1713964.1 hypothetical protein [Caproiciproducens galactitolivorans]